MLFLRSAAFGVLCGTALWTTLGGLAPYMSAQGGTRVALLPSPGRWFVLVAIVTATVAGLSWVMPRARSTDIAARRALRPLLFTGLLTLPYLPWLVEIAPVLSVLAGPGKWIVWGIVLAETGYRLAGLFLRRHVGAFEPWPHTRFLIAVSVVALLLSGGLSLRLTGTAAGLYPAGDEPHYLVMAQSLWQDGDLRIENNHDQRDYDEYFIGSELRPHYLTRGTDTEIYSVHPIGLPVLLAPVYAIDGYRAVRVFLVGVTAAVGVLLVIWLGRLGLSRAAAAFGWLAVLSSAPFVFFSFAVYPEMLAGLMVVTVMLLLSWPPWPPRSPRSPLILPWLGIGTSAGILPWLSTKYAPMAAVLVAVAMARAWHLGSGERTSGRFTRLAAVLLPFGASLLIWFAFFTAIWGTPSPTAPYGGDANTDPTRLLAGAPGLVFDQEYGVLPYAPVFILALTGLITMWRSGGEARRLSGEIVLIVGALLVSVGAFHIWWGGSAPPGRPVVSVLPILGMPIAWQYARLAASPGRATLARVLLFAGTGITVSLAFAQEGLLLANHRDGTSAFLGYLSPSWPLTDMFPSYIASSPLVALSGTVVWIAVCVLAIRLRRLSPILITIAAATVLSVIAPAVMPPLPNRATLIETRPRIGLLDHFDTSRLPTGVTYRPFRPLDPSEVPQLFSYTVQPPSAPGSSSLLYGRRLSLPAGQYDIGIATARDTPTEGQLSLQLGQFGPVFADWDLSLRAGESWSTSVRLDTDVGYVGFRATPALEAAQPVIRVTPREIMDVHARPTLPGPVLSTFRSRLASFYFPDDEVHREPTGFWTRRGRRTTVLVGRPQRDHQAARAVRIRTHCGPVANTLRITSTTWDETIQLGPGQAQELEVPARHNHVRLDIETVDGFVPAEIDTSSRDRRDLGCWVEVLEWLP